MSEQNSELGAGHGQIADEGQIGGARANQIGGHKRDADEGQIIAAPDPALAPLIAEIRYWHRQRAFAQEQRKRQHLALASFLRLMLGWSPDAPERERKRAADQALARIAIGKAEAKGEGADTDEPAYGEWRELILASLAAAQPFAVLEANAGKQMEKLAKRLPVWGWASGVRGLGALNLAIIVAEAGDLSAYPKKGHLWKRMGVAVMGEGDGRADLRQGGLRKGAAAQDWIDHGYNAARRSRLWNAGVCLIKGNRDGDYKAAYDRRKAYEMARAQARGVEMSKIYAHRRAQRYMEKRLLRDLWQAWRRASAPLPSKANYDAPAANPEGGAA